jgi:hypothetical protein
MAEKIVNPRMIWTVSILLAGLFAAFGVWKVLYPDGLGAPSAGDGSRLLARGLGAAFLLGAVLLLVPRLAWVGAAALAVILLGVIGVWLVQGAVSQTVIPALFVVSLVTLAYIRRPAGILPGRKPDTPAATNSSQPPA